MLLSGPLTKGILVKRYKRFLADVQLDSGETIVAHCPNPGSMLGCAEPGSTVLLRHSRDPKRKLPYTWVMTLVGKTHVSVDTLLANKLVHEALTADSIPELSGYTEVRPEYTFGDSRFDFCLFMEGQPACLIEVKSTTLAEGSTAMFPDARTERGRKHLHGLVAAKREGLRAVQFFCVSRNDVSRFAPAAHIDPRYAEALRTAAAAGVELMARVVDIEGHAGAMRASFSRSIPVEL